MKMEIIRFLRPRLALLLTVLMLVSVLPMSVGAEESDAPATRWEDQVSGTFTENPSNLSGYTHYSEVNGEVISETVTIDPAAPLGSKENPIAISSEEELILFGQQIAEVDNPSTGKYYILTQQTYDMGGHTMLPLAAAAAWQYGNGYAFDYGLDGVLIGNGAVIKNAYIVSGTISKGTYGDMRVEPALFGYLHNNGKIWDLTMENCTASGAGLEYGNVGVLYSGYNSRCMDDIVNVTITDAKLIVSEENYAFCIFDQETVNCTADVTLYGSISKYGLNLYPGEKLTIGADSTLTMTSFTMEVFAGAELVNNGTITGGTVIVSGSYSGTGTVTDADFQVHSFDGQACTDCDVVCGTDLYHKFGFYNTCLRCGYICGVTGPHRWESDGCSICGATCGHASVTERVCDNCGLVCGTDFKHILNENNTCTRCGFICGVTEPHRWTANGCEICGIICDHASFTEFVCDNCGLVCGTDFMHTFNESNTCTRCGFICGVTDAHSWDLDTCTRCGFVCEHETVADDACTLCGMSMGIVITMTDSYGDGWNGNAINIYENQTLKGTATISYGKTGVWTVPYDSTKGYRFDWVRSSFSNECSFKILIGGEVVYTSPSGCDSFVNQQTIFSFCDHVYGEGVVTDPTCTTPGSTDYTCTKCGYVQSEPIPTIPHDYDDGVVTAPTCTEEGYTTYTCVNCSDSYTGDSTPATGHITENGTCYSCGLPYEAAELNEGGYYELYTVGNLFWFAMNVNGKDTAFDAANAVLMADIDLTGWNWTPIGSTEAYGGVFDGNSHSISGMSIAEGVEHGGFIGWLQDGGVKDLSVSGTINLADANYCGMVVGRTVDSAVYNCTASGSITVSEVVMLGGYADCYGGLVGLSNHSVVLNCASHVDLSISATSDGNPGVYVGGIAGYMSVTDAVPGVCLLNSYGTGDIEIDMTSSNVTAGGLAGYIFDDAVNNYYLGNITQSDTSNPKIGYAFGEISTENYSSLSYGPLYAGNYCLEGKQSFGIETDVAECFVTQDQLADGSFVDMLNQNRSLLSEVISGHKGYISESKWQELFARFNGQDCYAAHWVASNGIAVHCPGNVDDECACDVCGKTYHIFGEATCEKGETCTNCGLTKEENPDHDERTYFDNGDGTHNAICECGATVQEAVAHSYHVLTHICPCGAETDVKNGIYTESNGLYYYEDGVRTYAGLIEVDGDYYYVRTSGEVVTNRSYWITKHNDLLPVASYYFGETGKLGDKNGFINENGGIYYYEDGQLVYAGLIEVDGDYYYVRSSGQVIPDGHNWITKTNDLLPPDSYYFDEDGKLYPPVDEVKSGIYQEGDKLYYYENNQRTYAGLIEIDGNYYYVRTSGEVVTNRSYWITKTNDLLPAGNYKFDENGVLIEA